MTAAEPAVTTVEPAVTAIEPAVTAIEPAPQPAPVPLRRNRDFLLLWAGAGGTMLAIRAAVIAYPLLVLWQTGSAGAAGLVASLVLLPQLLAPLPVGALVDRLDRRHLMILADIGSILATAAVVGLVWSGWPGWLPLACVAAFTHGSLAAVYQLAERASVVHVVPPPQLPAALSQNEARTRAASLLGPPAGSGLFALGAAAPFGFAALSHAVSLVLLLLIRKDFRATGTGPRRRLDKEVGEGIAWLWRRPFLRTVTVIIAATNVVFQGLTITMMVIVRDHGGSVAVVGVVAALAGAGGLAGALTAGWWMRRVSLRAVVVGSLAAWTLVTPAVAGTHEWLVLGLLFAANGYVGGVLTVAGIVYLTCTTPQALLGRVNSVASLVAFGPLAAGPVLAGALLDAYGSTRTVLAMAAVLALMLVAALLSPAVRDMRKRVGELAIEPS